jgi:hypothetical protein
VDSTDQRTGSRGPFPDARYHGAALVDSKNNIFIIEGRRNPRRVDDGRVEVEHAGQELDVAVRHRAWLQRGVNLGVATTMQAADGSVVDVFYAMT